MVGASGFLGYLGDVPHPGGLWPSGDLGYLDSDGFLHLSGRRKSAFATAFGRNLAPEWVEAELTSHACIAQAVVFGEGRPYNIAVIVPGSGGSHASVASAVRAANRRLPDYARVSRWILATEPFNPSNGLASEAGAMRREAVALRYGGQIEQRYAGETQHVAL